MFPFFLLQYLYKGLHISFSCEIKYINSSDLLFDCVELFGTDGIIHAFYVSYISVMSPLHDTVCDLVDIVISLIHNSQCILEIIYLSFFLDKIGYTYIYFFYYNFFLIQIDFPVQLRFYLVNIYRNHPFEEALDNLLPVEDVLIHSSCKKGIVSTSGFTGSSLLFRHGPGIRSTSVLFYSLVTGGSSQFTTQNCKD